jgi:hypothetical protein
MLYWKESHWSQCYIEWSPTEHNGSECNIHEFNALLNWIPLWNQCYWMKHQWIQCYNEWSPTEVIVMIWELSEFNVIEWNISETMLQWLESPEFNVIECKINEFNAIMYEIPLNSMLLNGTSVNSML